MNASSDLTVHIPVLPAEVLEYGQVTPGQTWVDGTAGGGGHTQLLAEQVGEHGRVIAMDRDPVAGARLAKLMPANVDVVQGSYHLLSEVLDQRGLKSVDGILLDLGLSSDQLADRERGFSFQTEGELDMRFDPTAGQPAWQWLQHADEKSIADTIYQYGEERFSRRIARRIVERRRSHPIRRADELRELIYASVPRGRRDQQGNRRHGNVDPATRTFQALRIQVNDELGILEKALAVMPRYLAPEKRLLAISFHSLEDRIVKHALRQDPRLEVVTKKPIIASNDEASRNPRSRSAKLRVASRLQKS